MNVFGYKRSDKAVKFKIGGVFFIRKVRFIFYFLNFVRQMLIEKQILSDLKKSDRSAFQSLFRYYYPRLKAYAATMVDDSVAEDLVQDLLGTSGGFDYGCKFPFVSVSRYLFVA